MAFFIFPQEWIVSAIAAAAIAFGSVDGVEDILIKYRNLPGNSLGSVKWPNKILIDKRPKREWPRAKAQCVIVHEYAHLAGRKHSKHPRSIMHPILRPKVCYRWLRRHGIR
jgi:predicted metal-dependent hydrolase